MRIINLKDFMAMPEGTVYSKYEPCIFGNLEIKVGNCGDHDWFLEDLNAPLEFSSGAQHVDQCIKMEEGQSVPLEFGVVGRDGCFEDGQLFAVYEMEDVLGLIARLQKTLEAKPCA